MQQDTTPMTVKNWLITILVLAIPFVNIIMYFVWAFSDSGNVNRKSYCQATLLFIAIIIAAVITFGVIGSMFSTY
jgi:hypothetical protein